jgi:hypothetical protein
MQQDANSKKRKMKLHQVKSRNAVSKRLGKEEHNAIPAR